MPACLSWDVIGKPSHLLENSPSSNDRFLRRSLTFYESLPLVKPRTCLFSLIALSDVPTAVRSTSSADHAGTEKG